MDLAALAALRQPVDLRIGGLLYEVPPAPVRAWIASLTEFTPLFALLDYDVAKRLAARLHDPYDEDVDHDALNEGWRQALESQSGWRWWEAERLLGLLVAQWTLLAGEFALRGQDLLLLPLDLALNASYRVQTRYADDKDKAELDKWLYEVPAHLQATEEAPPPRKGFSEEEQAAAWFAAARASGAARPSADAPARLS